MGGVFDKIYDFVVPLLCGIASKITSNDNDDQIAQKLQLLDAVSSFSVACLIPKGWQEPKTLLGGLVLRVAARLGEETGRDKRTAILLKQKLLAKLESLIAGIDVETCALPHEGHTSIKEPYRRCMKRYKQALADTVKGAQTLGQHVRAKHSLKDMEDVAEIGLQVDANTTSLKNSYKTLMHGIGREDRASEWSHVAILRHSKTTSPRFMIKVHSSIKDP
ncbi:hypothetical protein IW262DRAFT_1299026 [Armillaria fumosa]|nr:hypothetical protein IW262DRAFT_1299026 [Armillaria fumosa]